MQLPERFRPEALLFDLGGVLVDIDFGRALAHWAAHAGTTPEALRPRFVFDETLARYECAEVGAADYFARLREALGIDIPDEVFAQGWNAIFVDEVQGAARLLRSLEGRIPMYVFSNTNVDHLRVFAPRFAELLRPIDRVFTSCELRRRKPTPEAFHAVAQAIDVPPERIVFFDDLEANVEGARAVGMHAVHVRSIADTERAIASLDFFPRQESSP